MHQVAYVNFVYVWILLSRETLKSQVNVWQRSETDCSLAFESLPSCALLLGEEIKSPVTASENPSSNSTGKDSI